METQNKSGKGNGAQQAREGARLVQLSGLPGSDQAGATAARRRDPSRAAASEQPSSHLAWWRLSATPPLSRWMSGMLSALLRLCRGPGERAPGWIPSPWPLRRGRGPCSFLEAAARSSERAQRQRRLVASAHWKNATGSARSPAPLLLQSERAAGRPKVQGSLSAPPVQPNRKEHREGTSWGVCACQL